MKSYTITDLTSTLGFSSNKTKRLYVYDSPITENTTQVWCKQYDENGKYEGRNPHNIPTILNMITLGNYIPREVLLAEEMETVNDFKQSVKSLNNGALKAADRMLKKEIDRVINICKNSPDLFKSNLTEISDMFAKLEAITYETNTRI